LEHGGMRGRRYTARLLCFLQWSALSLSLYCNTGAQPQEVVAVSNFQDLLSVLGNPDTAVIELPESLLTSGDR
jgi:hypothetical protein